MGQPLLLDKFASHEGQIVFYLNVNASAAKEREEGGGQDQTENGKEVSKKVRINWRRSCYNCFSGSCCRYWKRFEFPDSFRGAKSIIIIFVFGYAALL